jgi:DHA2 family multidrug resistance protein
MLWRANFSPQADLAFIVIPQFVQGLALACFFVPITSLTFIGLNPARIAGASGLFNCIRTIFASIGASAVTTLWERREALHHARLTELRDLYEPVVRETFETLAGLGLTQEQAAGFLARQITNQGFILAAAEIYQLCAGAFLLLIALTWLAKPGLRPGA